MEERFVQRRSGIVSLYGRRDNMQFRGILGLVALVAVSCSIGCSMTSPTVRGQAPDSSGPIIGSAPGYGDFQKKPYLGRHDHHDFKPLAGAADNNYGYEGGFYRGPDGPGAQAYTVDASGCPSCQDGNACPQDGCQRCGRGCGYRNGMPQHVQTYQYDWPQNMVYPQQGVPAGMVQYPYYTLRGPTDFFMK